MIPDKAYVEKLNRMRGTGYPLVQFWRKIEGICLAIRYKGFAGIINKIKRHASRKKTIEK